jgi:4'-phosphopantetheinyl transferase
MRWGGGMPARAARKKNVWPTSKKFGRICARSVCAKRWKALLATVEPTWLAPPASLTLTGGEIHIWRANLNPPASQIEQFAAILAADEQQRAARFHFKRDRRRFIVGRGVLRLILGYYLGLSPGRVQFSYGAWGKPALAETFGRAEEQLFFNLAHSGEMAVYAMLHNQEIGVDVEQIRPMPDLEQIALRFFAVQEQAALLRLPAGQRQDAFFNCWTRKEAYIKALGVGLAQPLDQFCVSLAPGEPANLVSIAGSEVEAAGWLLEAFSPAAGYVASVAVAGQGWQLTYWDWPATGV